MPARDYYLPQRRLVSQEDASMIERANIPRSKFTGSWSRKTAFDAGKLIPFLVEEILPGDHMRYSVTAYVRMATPLFPVLDSQRIDTFFFFVPCRLLWDNWVRMMGEQDTPGASIDFTVPQIVSPAGGFPEFGIYDHMGLPVEGQITAGETISVNALPLRAYNLIFNQWFRDQNIVAGRFFTRGNGPDTSTEYVVLTRNKSHDYFTTCLPWPQKFDPPTIPIGGTAPVITDSNVAGNVAIYSTAAAAIKLMSADTTNVEVDTLGGTSQSQMFADLEQATGVDVNSFRQAFMIQALLERDARGGTRYTELIRSHFGVTNPDFRLQRPEYIGGGSTPLQVTPIAQTSFGNTGAGETPLGALGGAGTAAGQHSASYAATEHGYILGLINVKTELSYQQGLHKMWTRKTRYDFYMPALAQLGEQAVLRKEIYCTGDDTDDELVFGYQERWHEYRTRVSEVTGVMRSTATGSIDQWHFAQEFSPAPTLNTTFLNETPPMTRVLAASSAATNQQYLADILIQRTAVRPIPSYGTPALLGRF